MKNAGLLKLASGNRAASFAVWSLMIVSLVGMSAVAGGSTPTSATRFDTPTETRSFADVVEMVMPGVVEISVSRRMDAQPTSSNPRFGAPGDPATPFDDFFGRFFDSPGMAPDSARPVRALGSGFVIDEAGYIVTNNHVVENADKIRVLLHDGREFEASLVGTDPKTDLALLKVESKTKLPALRFGDSGSARVGDWVLAIGNPFGLGGSATAGIISARGRDIRSGPYDDYLQIDAPINSGNSGGPVFNADGEVIGVNTAIFSPNGGNVGIGFAIPAKQVQTVVAELRDSGVVHRGWLGVQIQDIDEDLASSLGLASSGGALVADVVSDSPAFRADLRVGDVITQFGDEAITSAKSLSIAVAETDPSAKMPVKIWRDGKQKSLQVKLGEAEQMTASTMSEQFPHGAAGSELGLALSELTDGYRQRLGLPDDFTGVIITRVEPNSSAAMQGLQPGDVITRVGSTSVKSVADAKVAISKAKSVSEHAALLIRRRDGQQYVSVAFS